MVADATPATITATASCVAKYTGAARATTFTAQETRRAVIKGRPALTTTPFLPLAVGQADRLRLAASAEALPRIRAVQRARFVPIPVGTVSSASPIRHVAPIPRFAGQTLRPRLAKEAI